MAITARFFGFNPPFIGGTQNVMSRQVDSRLIKNDLLQLLMTLPGERVYRPNFGTRLRAVVFETVSDDDLVGLAQDIRAAIATNEDRVKVDNITCTSQTEGQSISVRLDVSLTDQPLIKYLIELTFNQNGSITLSK